MTDKCKSCDHVVGASAWRCPNCGSEVPTTTVTVGKVLYVCVAFGLLFWFLSMMT